MSGIGFVRFRLIHLSRYDKTVGLGRGRQFGVQLPVGSSLCGSSLLR